jgi:3-phosphoshikimate 1-carboxyvinyltransferase
MPADKSVAHRALLFSAMGSGSAVITLDSPGDDVRSMAEALRALGAIDGSKETEDGSVAVTVRGGGSLDAARLPGEGGETLDCGNAGTAMRLLAGALAGRPASAVLVGDASLSARPMERIAEPLRRTGATVETTDGHAPVRVTGKAPLAAADHAVPVASAQVIGCLSLAGLAADGTTTITVPGPTRDHTERILAWLGVPIRREGLATIVSGPSGFAARDIRVPGDISSAAAWLVAGALHPDAVIRLEEVGLNPSRIGVIEVLRDMGADIEVELAGEASEHPEPVGHVTVRGGRPLRAIDLGGDRVADVIDELPLLGVAMAAAEGPSELRDAAELRVKESDRIALVAHGLTAIGARVEERPDGWVVERGTRTGAAIRTAGDHRIAMAFAVAGLTGVAGPVDIDEPACAAVSYPGFWSDLASLVA